MLRAPHAAVKNIRVFGIVHQPQQTHLIAWLFSLRSTEPNSSGDMPNNAVGSITPSATHRRRSGFFGSLRLNESCLIVKAESVSLS